MRIQLDFPEKQVNTLEKLMKVSGARTKNEFFTNILSLYEWVVKEKRAGRSIVSTDDESRTQRELVMPILSNISSNVIKAAKKSTTLLSESALKKEWLSDEEDRAWADL